MSKKRSIGRWQKQLGFQYVFQQGKGSELSKERKTVNKEQNRAQQTPLQNQQSRSEKMGQIWQITSS